MNCKNLPTMRASANISPTGPLAPNFSPAPAQMPTARDAYEMAIGLERDDAVRRFLRQRQAALKL